MKEAGARPGVVEEAGTIPGVVEEAGTIDLELWIRD